MKNRHSQFHPVVSWLPFVLLLAVIGSGCGPRSTISEREHGVEWRAVVLKDAEFPLAPELRLLVWRDHLDPELLKHFEKRYGVRLELDYFSSNEELHAMVTAPDAAYDLIMPSGYMVEQLRNEGLLQPIERDQIANFDRLDPRFFAHGFDPGLRYSMPIFYFCVGIALNVQHAAGMPAGMTWRALAAASDLPLVQGRRAMIDEMRLAMGTALIMLGYSPNTRDPEEIAQARDFFIQTIERGGLHLYHDDMTQKLIDEEILVAVEWSGGAGAAIQANGMVRFIIPAGPVLAGVDCFAIPTHARSPATARLFLNFLLIPEVTGALTNYNYYANTSSASFGFVAREIRNGPGFMYPLADSAVYLTDVGEALPLYEHAWTAIKAIPQPDVQPLPLPAFRRERRGTGDDWP